MTAYMHFTGIKENSILVISLSQGSIFIILNVGYEWCNRCFVSQLLYMYIFVSTSMNVSFKKSQFMKKFHLFHLEVVSGSICFLFKTIITLGIFVNFNAAVLLTHSATHSQCTPYRSQSISLKF